jgi:HEAT repeat protein
MEAHAVHSIEALLASANPNEVRWGLEVVRDEISKVGSEEARPLFEMVSTLFYIDPLDRPDLAPLLDEAISLVVGFGQWVIPVLLQKLDAGDLKAQMASAQALGRIGADAIAPLLAEYESAADSARRTFILYALSKIKSPKIVQVAPLTLEAAQSPDRELRDTAIRVMGKLAECIPSTLLSEEMRCGFLETFQKNLADENTAIRAKAMRSLGKLAQYGHLTAEERAKLKTTFKHFLGNDEYFEWDRAFVVRKEAEEALKCV